MVNSLSPTTFNFDHHAAICRSGLLLVMHMCIVHFQTHEATTGLHEIFFITFANQFYNNRPIFWQVRKLTNFGNIAPDIMGSYTFSKLSNYLFDILHLPDCIVVLCAIVQRGDANDL